jgi:hypothetical protein
VDQLKRKADVKLPEDTPFTKTDARIVRDHGLPAGARHALERIGAEDLAPVASELLRRMHHELAVDLLRRMVASQLLARIGPGGLEQQAIQLIARYDADGYGAVKP